jgi:XTP/dITP diphosphohydrolase
METVENRDAQFRTVIVLILDGCEYLFEGIIRGRIKQKPEGTSGFGYDPVFVPNGYEQTFAELGDEIKSAISHRSIATRKLVHLLQHYSSDHKP